jgi:hypothetical protein
MAVDDSVSQCDVVIRMAKYIDAKYYLIQLFLLLLLPVLPCNSEEERLSKHRQTFLY